MSGTFIGGAFLSSVISGLVPIVNGEVVAAGAALAASPDTRLPVLAACVAGQMLAKICLYGLARYSPERLPRRARHALAGAREVPLGRRSTALMVLASAGIGLPPFYVVTLAAGALRLSPALFVIAGTCGTVARYAVIVWGATRFQG
jgi:membrane protein YqaA with SNARE-associated domain